MVLLTDSERAVQCVSGIRPKPADGRLKPHKPCLLLAVIDLFEANLMKENSIEFDATPRLIETFNAYFKAVAIEGDQARACMPYVHLATDGFWHLQARPGREQEVREKPSKGGVTDSWVRNNVSSARLDEFLYKACLDPVTRNTMRNAIVTRFFSDKSDQIRSEINRSLESIRYELQLRHSEPTKKLQRQPEEPVRSSSFRRLVLEAYDYRCAASGWRVILPDVKLIEAAHLIPWSESKDDSAQNGMALTPTFHRAMDANLIAPSPKGVWKVSKLLSDPRIKDFEPFKELAGKKVILPSKHANYPREDSLQYRVDRLRQE